MSRIEVVRTRNQRNGLRTMREYAARGETYDPVQAPIELETSPAHKPVPSSPGLFGQLFRLAVRVGSRNRALKRTADPEAGKGN